MAKDPSEVKGGGCVLFAVPDYTVAGEKGFACVDMYFYTNRLDSFTDVRDVLKLARAKGTGIAVTGHNLIGSAVRVAGNKDW